MDHVDLTGRVATITGATADSPEEPLRFADPTAHTSLSFGRFDSRAYCARSEGSLSHDAELAMNGVQGNLAGQWLAGYSGTLHTTATCRPGELGRTAVIENGDLSLDAGLGSTNIAIPEATGDALFAQNAGSRSGHFGTYTYTATITHVRSVDVGYAKSDLYLNLRSETRRSGSEQWQLTLALASAECGLNRAATAIPERPRPGAGIFRTPAARAMPMAAFEVEPSELGQVENVVGRDGEAPLPSLDDVRSDLGEVQPVTPAEATPGTSATPQPPVSSSTPLAAPSPAPAEPAPHPGSTRPTDVDQDTPVSTARPRPVPLSPQETRPGEEFAVTTLDGVELGTVRVDGVQRTAVCGVRITMQISTSDQVGSTRWATLTSDDFLEVRPGGAEHTVEATSSECADNGDSGMTRLRVGADHVVVIGIPVSNTAHRLILRPPGTAGWALALPAATAAPASAPVSTTVRSQSQTSGAAPALDPQGGAASENTGRVVPVTG